MQASDRHQVRPIVVDFLATLFYTFCVGVTTAVVLGACVVLLAGEARGSDRATAPSVRPSQAVAPAGRCPATTLIAHRRAGAPSRVFSLSASQGAPAALGRECEDAEGRVIDIPVVPATPGGGYPPASERGKWL